MSTFYAFGKNKKVETPIQSTLWESSMLGNYKDAWVEQKKILTQLEEQGLGNSKIANQARNNMIAYWNKLSPQQQKDIAEKYCPEN